MLVEEFADGELLSGTLSALVVAVGATAIVGRPVDPFVLAGALGALAVSIKQSGVDGFGAVFAWLSLAAAFSFGGERRRHLWGSPRSLVACFAMATPFIVHGAITGSNPWRRCCCLSWTHLLSQRSMGRHSQRRSCYLRPIPATQKAPRSKEAGFAVARCLLAAACFMLREGVE